MFSWKWNLISFPSTIKHAKEELSVGIEFWKHYHGL